MTSVGTYMTTTPHTIGREQSLDVARHLMSEHHVRHLPVLHGGDLVGVLSDREVTAFEVLPGSRHLTEETMVPEFFVTVECVPLDHVAAEMARRHIGSAVVVAESDGSIVLGVFTPIDALGALSESLRAAAKPAA